jgi:heat shock protein HslJ
MQDGAGRAFGERLRVGIQVAAVPTPTPGPTQTPVAGISFAADAQRVQQGSPVTLRWAVADAEAVYFYRAGQDWQGHAVDAQGEATDIPNTTTTYQLRVVRDGQAEDRLLTVYVEPDPALPQVAHFALSASGELAVGECVSVTWAIEGEVEQVAIFRDKQALWEDAPLAGVLEDCPPAVGEYEYAVGAQGPGGRNYAVATLRVVDATAAPAVAPGPLIERFAVLPETLPPGGCVDIQWTVSGAAATIQVLRDDAVLLDGAPATGSGADCPTEPGMRRYRLVAADAAGQTSVSAVTVAVAVAAPEQTPAPPAADSAPAVEPAAPTAPGQETPAGHEYLLISYRNVAGELVAPLTGTQITLAFGADGTLSGHGGCNRYSSRWQVQAATLAIAPPAATEMFCAEPIGLMDQEAQYLNVLPQAVAWGLEAGQLTLLDSAGNPLAIYVMAQ